MSSLLGSNNDVIDLVLSEEIQQRESCELSTSKIFHTKPRGIRPEVKDMANQKIQGLTPTIISKTIECWNY